MQGVVYMDESVLGWRPLAEAWLANRSPQESHVSSTSEHKSAFIGFNLIEDEDT